MAPQAIDIDPIRRAVGALGTADAAQLLGELQDSTGRHFDEYLGASDEQRANAQRRLLMALELRWKLEEQVLLPALQDGGDACVHGDVQSIAEETELLRELSAVVSKDELPASTRIVVIGVLEGIAELQSVRIERALATAKEARSIDSAALAEEMAGLLHRWRGELATSGDIEDEELDPVGQPPR